MIIRSIAVMMFLCITGLFIPATVPESLAESTIYSNQDIEKYKRPADNTARAEKNSRSEAKKEKAGKAAEQQEKEYWCKQATSYKNKMDKAQDEAGKQEKRLAELKDAAGQEIGKKRKSLEKEISNTQKKLKNAQKQLEDRQKDLDRLEGEAHKKGVPPGWLRCQFTW